MIKWISPLIGLFILALSGLLWGRLNQPIVSVRVTGDLDVYEREAIRQAVSPSLDQGLLRLRLADVKADIYRLSWSRNVTVRRLWPAGLAIGVEREQAVARWGTGGGTGGYLSTRGGIMPGPPEAGQAFELPTLRCASASPREAMEVYRLLSDVLAPAGVEIATLSESALGVWAVQLAAGPRVVLGRDHLVERLQRFVVVYRQVLRDRLDAVRYADARYANGVAVRWIDPLVASNAERKYGIGR